MAPPAAPTRCLYEILGVSRDCSVEEIRSAYKKQALLLHPDKVAQSGGGGAAADTDATAAFQDLQHAYDVLRDPKERAWYDAHRSQILFASNRANPSSADDDGLFSSFVSSFFSKFASSYGHGAGRGGFNSSMDDLGDIYSFFSPSAYSGFSDTGRGFYKVYGDLFSKIYSNEVRFAMEVGQGGDPGEALEPAPLMGNLESPYEQWTAFYDFWLGFSTVIDFSWADMYDAREAVNRKERREMEELNKKMRKKMREEYNDTVRSLAAFVKKRDKRMVDMIRKKKAEEEEKKEEQRKKKEEEKKRKEEEARLYREAEWTQIDEEVEEEGLFDGWYGPGANDNRKAARVGDKGGEELYCVVCSKKFKSDKQWKNHEQSKKHRDKVAELRESLQDEDEALGCIGEDVEGGVDVSFDYVQEPYEDSDNSVVDGLCEEFEGSFGFQEQAAVDVDSEAGEEASGSEDEDSVLKAMVSSHKSRKAVYVEQSDSSPGKVPHHSDEGGSSTEYDIRKKGHRRPVAKKGNSSKPATDDPVAKKGNSSKPATDDVQAKDIKGNPCDDEVRTDEVNAEWTKESDACSINEVGSSFKGGRNLGKNLKSKKQQFDGNFSVNKDTDIGAKRPSKGKKQKGTWKAPANACGTCGESFDSRNKLFAHLGDTGHAVLKSR